jgi:hypothetical protein
LWRNKVFVACAVVECIELCMNMSRLIYAMDSLKKRIVSDVDVGGV